MVTAALLLCVLFAPLDYMRWWLDHSRQSAAYARVEQHDREKAASERQRQCSEDAAALAMYARLYSLYTRGPAVDADALRRLPRTMRAIEFFEKKLKPCRAGR